MKFATVLDRDEDGMWIAECPPIPGCVSQGKTREEALANIKEAIALCLEVRVERGMPDDPDADAAVAPSYVSDPLGERRADRCRRLL
jgi:predicted RNase H-like HicB family nuclease